MLKWIKNKFLNDTSTGASHEEEIIQETIVHRDSIDIQNEQNEHDKQQNFCFSLVLDETSQSVVQQQIDIGSEVRNERNNLEQSKQNYHREYSSLFLLEEVKEEEFVKLKPKPRPRPTSKGPFKPTRVPSPIYGFKPRPEREKKEEIITSKKIVEETPIQIVEELQSKQKKEEFVETIEEIRNSKEEQPVELKKEINKHVAEVIEETEENLMTELSVAEKQEERTKTKKRVVPYNVIMRQQDRRKMMRVREQKEKQSNSRL